jgi:RHS repeat-associated protein
MWVKRINEDITEKIPFRFTGKEYDDETKFYYYGARYLNPKLSRWLTTDPAMGEYIPGAPINDEAKKRNNNLPGMGGVYNVINMHLYHYAGNNPVKYMDPDGKILRNPDGSILETPTGNMYTVRSSGQKYMQVYLFADDNTKILAYKNIPDRNTRYHDTTDAVGEILADGQYRMHIGVPGDISSTQKVESIIKGDGYKPISKDAVQKGDVFLARNKETGNISLYGTVEDYKKGGFFEKEKLTTREYGGKPGGTIYERTGGNLTTWDFEFYRK